MEISTLEEFFWQLRRTFRELAMAGDRELSELGITTSDRAMLEFLAKEPQPISLAALARKRAVSRQHVSQSLQHLDPRWIERNPDIEDRRSVRVQLSPAGRQIWKRIQEVDLAFLDRLDRHLSQDEIAQGVCFLGKVRGAIADEITAK